MHTIYKCILGAAAISVPVVETIEMTYKVDLSQEARAGAIALQLGMPTQRHAEFGGDNPLDGFVIAPTVAKVTSGSISVTSFGDFGSMG